MARVLSDLFENMCSSDTIPEDWSESLVVKIPEEANITNCDNWRGITLLLLLLVAFKIRRHRQRLLLLALAVAGVESGGWAYPTVIPIG